MIPVENNTIGAAEMEKHGFKGVFFVMTVSINRPNYLTKEQIAALSDTGNVIAAHTWDHHRVTKYTGDDWNTLSKTKGKTGRNHRKTCDVFCISFWFME
jgi:peptidoglycan/xylan/chitin deacetylase (PgdA/CDA1 family)